MNSRGVPLPHDAVVLLTGASAGLGLAIARRLLDTSYRLILTARSTSLSRFAEAGIFESERVWLRPLDVTATTEREAVIAEADARWGGVDVLINNAGVAYRAVVEHITDECRYEQMSVNFRAPLEMIRLVLPRMREKRTGRILNVSSVGGMMAMPTMGIYSASKFALEGASEALWYEMRPWNIHVSLIQPGFIHSESFAKTRYSQPSQWSWDHNEEAYHAHYEHMTGMIARLMNGTWATPEHVANVVVRTLGRRSPPLRVAATPDARIFGLIRRFMPRKLYHRILYACLPKVKTWGRVKDSRFEKEDSKVS